MARAKSMDAELAALGARVKIAELQKQIDDLRRRFPSARNSPTPSESAPATKRGRRAMSAKERAAVAKRMKRYWAERRKKAAKS